MMNAPRLCTALAAMAILVAGALLYPRPPADASPNRVIAQVLASNTQSLSSPVDQIRRELREGCSPILEGSDTLSGRAAWPIRLKPPNRRYPWLEVWADKKSGKIIAWKEWGILNKHVTILRQFPKP